MFTQRPKPQYTFKKNEAPHTAIQIILSHYFVSNEPSIIRNPSRFFCGSLMIVRPTYYYNEFEKESWKKFKKKLMGLKQIHHYNQFKNEQQQEAISNQVRKTIDFLIEELIKIKSLNETLHTFKFESAYAQALAAALDKLTEKADKAQISRNKNAEYNSELLWLEERKDEIQYHLLWTFKKSGAL